MRRALRRYGALDWADNADKMDFAGLFVLRYSIEI